MIVCRLVENFPMPGVRAIYSSHVCSYNFHCFRIGRFYIPRRKGTVEWFAVTTKGSGMQKAPPQQGLIASDKLFALLRKRNYYTKAPSAELIL
jgi:hypothetical protein